MGNFGLYSALHYFSNTRGRCGGFGVILMLPGGLLIHRADGSLWVEFALLSAVTISWGGPGLVPGPFYVNSQFGFHPPWVFII